MQTWNQYRNHGVLPQSGGWDDQPHGLVVEDWGYLNWCYDYVLQELQNDKDPDAKPDDLKPLIHSMSGDTNAMTWSQIRDQS